MALEPKPPASPDAAKAAKVRAEPSVPGAEQQAGGAAKQHKNIVLDVIRQIYPAAFDDLTTDAHERVEIIAKDFRFNNGGEKKNDVDGRIVHFVNITGFSGNTYLKPHIQRNIAFTMKMASPPSRAYRLTDKKPVSFKYANGAVSMILTELGEYEAVVLER